MVQRKETAKKKRKKDWRRLAGVRPPVIEKLGVDIPGAVVWWLNNEKGIPLQFVLEHIRRRRAGEEMPDDWLVPGITAESIVIGSFVTELHQWGALDRLRICDGCGIKWFFAQHLNYRFCSTTCRDKFHRGTPAALEKTKLRMREYRANLKRKNENQARAKAAAAKLRSKSRRRS